FILDKQKTKYEKAILNHYDGFGFRSKNLLDNFNRLFSTNKHKFLVYSGAPDNIQAEISRKPRTNIKELKLLYVGKLVENKNVDKILLSLAKIEKKINFRFKIIGDGPEKENLITLIK
ncbi:glycosyltransferase, partial [Neobacillus vireti]|uniref:glycosyltransferase n=1 Tax=Neobacillus vireti TaxID=220686 RepID=UPI003000A1CA